MIKLLNNFLKPLENKYIGTAVGLFLVLYIQVLKPTPPPFVKNLFKNNLFKAVFIFLLAYLSDKNIHVSLIISVLFIIYSNSIAQEEVLERFGLFGDLVEGAKKLVAKVTGNEQVVAEANEEENSGAELTEDEQKFINDSELNDGSTQEQYKNW